MPTFLAPAALFGLALLAIPIIVHLLKPRKMRRTPFSSLRWLQLTQQKLSRRFRWHQLFLFLLRAAFIALLVAAVAKPVLDRRSAASRSAVDGKPAGAPTDRFVVLDVSRSMGYRAGDRPTPLEAGKKAAAALLAGGGPNDRTALLTVGATTKIVGPLVRGGDRHIPKLSPLTAESTSTDLGSALETIATLTAARRNDPRLSNTLIELFLVTDRHQGSVRPEEIEALTAEFPGRITATIVDAAPPAPSNGWIADAAYLPAESGSPPAVEVQLRAVGTAQERTIRLVGIAGREDRSRTITLDPTKPLSLAFELPPDFDPHGQTCELVLDPPDALPNDDRWHLAFDAGAAHEVLIIDGRDRSNGTAAGFTLRTALEALTSSAKPIRVASKKFNEVEPADFATVDVVLWADVPQLSDVALEALTARVHAGLGLGIFLGFDVDADFYNRRLIDPLDRAKSLLPWKLERLADVPAADGGSAPLAEVDRKHPLLAGLFDPTIGDLGQVRVRSHYVFTATNAADAGDRATNVLASADGAPILIERTVGQGNVVLFNATADDAWSDLPRRKSFVPLLDRLLNQLSGGSTERSFKTGEAFVLSVAPPAEGESLRVTGPSGDVASSAALVGTKARVTVPPLADPGVYHLRRQASGATNAATTETAFVVQVDRADSSLTAIPDDTLRTWWEPAGVKLITTAEAVESPSGEHVSLVGWAVLLAALLFAAEMVVVHRLCPRMNPPAAELLVERKPIVAHGTRTGPLESTLPPLVRNA